MRWRWLILSGIWAAVVAALPSPVTAQAYQCRAPAAPISIPTIRPDGPTRQASIGGYTLAASWSPEYCRLRRERTGDRWQCGGEGGRFGFVLHGLWPEATRGPWPQWCPTRQRPPPVLVARHMCMIPSPRLAARQ